MGVLHVDPELQSVPWKMVEGLGAFKDPARSDDRSGEKKESRGGRCSGYSATVLHHLRSSMLSDREGGGGAATGLPRVSLKE